MLGVESQGIAPSEAVECDPTKRYWRFEDVLGSGACKTVFKAFDSHEGIEVAWNKVALGSSTVTEDPMRKRLFSEIHVLKRLQHKNIMTFHDYWLDSKTNTLNFITEFFTHGSLKKFRAKHKHLALPVLKKWAWQILQGLVYLHGHEPPIIHRDLKCDNVFINGVTGDLKIGDLGFATLWRGIAPLSVIGTPEFMAPEFYNENYDERVDVYAFGMLLLELVSMDYPYCECTNPASIYKKVSQGIYPASFQKIKNQELQEFIALCIVYDPDRRPEARQLLKHEFFNSVRKMMEPHKYTHEKSEAECGNSEHSSASSSGGFSTSCKAVDPTMTTACVGESHGSEPAVMATAAMPSSIHDFMESRSECASESVRERNQNGNGNGNGDGDTSTRHNGFKITIECTKRDIGPILEFSLKYQDDDGDIKTIEFPFNIIEDTAEQIIMEMRADSADFDFLITEEEAAIIGELIGDEVDKWKLKDQGQLRAYVNVMRKPCDGRTENCQDNVASEDADKAMQTVESTVGDMCQSMATDLSPDNVFKTLDKESPALLMGIVAGKESSSRRSIKSKLTMTTAGVEDDLNSDNGLNEGAVLFSSPSVNHKNNVISDSNVILDEVEHESNNGHAIDIPSPKRRMSATIERSYSLSSSISESKMHHCSEGGISPLSKAVQRRLSGRNYLSSEYQPSSLRNSFKKALSFSTDMKIPSSSSYDQNSATAEVPVELSFILIEPQNEGETPVKGSSWNQKLERNTELEPGQDSIQQGNNTSLISVVTMKPSTPVSSTSSGTVPGGNNGAGGGCMPTVPELSSSSLGSQIYKRPPKQHHDLESARSKADEYAWRIANAPLVKTSEAATSQQTHSPECSPRSTTKYVESNGSSTELGGLKTAPDNSQDHPIHHHHKNVGTTHLNNQMKEKTLSKKATLKIASTGSLAGSLVDQQQLAYGERSESRSSHLEANLQNSGTKVSNLTTVNLQQQDFNSSRSLIVSHQNQLIEEQKDKDPAFLLNGFNFPSVCTSGRRDCHSEYHYERTGSWLSGSIKAVRKNPSIDTPEPPPFNLDKQGHLTVEAQHNLDRMFKSCADLSHLESRPLSADFRGHSAAHPFHEMQDIHTSPYDTSNIESLKISDSYLTYNMSSYHHHQGSSHGLDGPHHKYSGSFAAVEESGLSVESCSQKEEDKIRKYMRRRQAEENIGRMQEQQLEGLCLGGSVGVGVNRHKTHRPSMNGL